MADALSLPPLNTVVQGDCLEVMRGWPDACVDAVVTDPPYGLGFMGKDWDSTVPPVAIWRECWRVLKPGGHLLAFAGTRTYHRMAVNIEDAGFEIRDMLSWLYGSGFPKSLDVSKQIDKAAGAERGTKYRAHGDNKVFGEGKGKAAGVDRTPGAVLSDPPATEAARQWQGWGTALKPSHEPVCVARKPLIGTVAENVLAHGTGSLNIDGCRIDSGGESWEGRELPHAKMGVAFGEALNKRSSSSSPLGRWPANVLLDEEAARLLDEQSGYLHPPGFVNPSFQPAGKYAGQSAVPVAPGDGRTPFDYGDAGGGASRFFYTAKASSSERNAGCGALSTRPAGGLSGRADGSLGSVTRATNFHPTVKPVDLMRWLVRLITPPGGIVLDPFFGSGTTGVAANREGFAWLGIELSPDYCAIARARTAQQGLAFAEDQSGDLEVAATGLVRAA